MLCRFLSLRFQAANVCKLAATRRTTSLTFNLLLHTSRACKGTPKKPDETEKVTEKKADSDLSNLIKRTDSLNIDERPSVAVLLAGCGHWDGTLPVEAVSLAIHLDRRNIKADYYAGTHRIEWAINHSLGDGHIRYPHEFAEPEALRIAHDDARRIMEATIIHDTENLIDYKCNRFYGGLFIPGGDGTTNWLFLKDMWPVVHSFANGKKERPIGTISNGGYGTAEVLSGVKITIGKTEETVSNFLEDQWVKYMTESGANLQAGGVRDVVHCETYNIYSTPGHLAYDSHHYYDIYLGVGKLVDAMKENIERWQIDNNSDCN
ncbi:hypothetical protein TKK_0003397 [Trichogramma kaykai]|uniref:DJ-1/PfpI domain-containing protein n=2 Tax=Trichogramma kaykai TaxID=54128 RepID=A0ABD2XPP8_9HYME